MLHTLLEGIILGITVSITLGPALVALLQTSIKHGVKIGIFLAMGIFFSDLTIVVGAYFGATQIVTNPAMHLIFGVIGGTLMIGFGIFSMTRKVILQEQVEVISEIRVKKRGVLPYFFKGYILNIANPFLWAFWLTSVIAITSTYRGDKISVALFFTGTLATVLTTDILKSILENKIKVANNPYVKLWVNRIVGLIFICFGLFVIISIVFDIPVNIK